MSALYYSHAGVTIWHGDAREILPGLGLSGCTIITDPVWPNSSPALRGAERPTALFAEVAQHFPRMASRAVIQLGCDSDPRFLLGIPASMPFLRTIWLEYAVASYKGRLLNTGDVAYAFGSYPAVTAGRRVLPGKYIGTRTDPERVRLTVHRKWDQAANEGMHPAPRMYQHVAYLVGKWAEGVVLDPFMGSGTTLVAAKKAGLQAVGIEIEERFCEIAATRLAQDMLPGMGQDSGAQLVEATDSS